MEDLKNVMEKDTITSLELVDQINFFRKEEGKKKDLRHDTLLNIIRDEFEEEIQDQKILELFRDVEVGNGAIKKSPYYILNLSQAKQVLMRESKFVRRAVIHYIEELEKQLENTDTKYLKEQAAQMTELENRIEALERGYKQSQIDEPVTVSGYARLKGVFLETFICANIGKMATHICQTHNIPIKRLYDARYGFINAYPVKVLDRVFDMYFNR